MGSGNPVRSQRSIFRFWVPLAATWLMMSVEGPFLAAIIARLADPTFNLAAYGVAFAFALLVEAPVIMMMSASTALAEDDVSFLRLRRFAFGLNAVVTVGMLLFLIPPIYRVVMHDLIALPDEVVRLTYGALWLLLPWPSAIGYRRFYQGLLIRDGRTRLVAYGTVLRVSTMAATGIALYLTIAPPGVYVGAAALTVGVVMEAIVSRVMARGSIARVLDRPAADPRVPTYGRILRFYYPLALTSFIGLTLQPMLTFFMGRAPSPVESLAVFPVVHALSFIFRALGLSYQEAAIALMGKRFEHAREVGRFAFMLGLGASAGLGIVALTPLAIVWFQSISGLSAELTRFALLPTILLIPIPGLSVLKSLQQAILVTAHRTRPITLATAIEVGVVALAFTVLSASFGWAGVTSAMAAFLIGRVASVLYLMPLCARAVRRGA